MLNSICLGLALWTSPVVSLNQGHFGQRLLSLSLAFGLVGVLQMSPSSLAAPPVKRPGTAAVKHTQTVKSAPHPPTAVNSEAWAKKVNAEMAAGQSAYTEKRYTESERLARLLLPDLPNPRFTLAGRAVVYQLLGLSIMQREGNPARFVEARRYLALSNDTIKTSTKPDLEAMRLNNRFYIAEVDALMGHQEQAVAEYRALLSEKLPDDAQTQLRVNYAKQMIAAFTNSDNAANYLGQFPAPYTHWHGLLTRPLRVYIQNASALEDWHAEYPTLVRKAYGEWQSQLPDVFRFEFVDQPEQADTVVSWTPDPIPEADTTRQELGRCEFQYYGATIQKADITLSLHNIGHVPVTQQALYGVTLHEIGHSLGFAKAHSNNPSDIMFASTLLARGSSGHLTARDIATMKALYAQPAGYTNPDIPLALYRQYTGLSRLASDAMVKKDYPQSLGLAHQALGLYDKDPEAHYILGASLYGQKAYGAALPELLQVVSMEGTQKPYAYIMATSCLLTLAQTDFRAYNRPQGLQHLQMAQNFIDSHRGQIVLNQEMMAEQAKLEQALQLSMQFAQQDEMRSNNATVLYGISDSGKATNDSGAADSKKKKGWWGRFLDASAASDISVPVRLPIPASAF